MARLLRPEPRAFQTYELKPEDVLTAAPSLNLKGHDLVSPLSNMSPDYARLMRNLCIRYGAYQTRSATNVIGAIASSQLVYALDAELTNGTFKLTRFRDNGVDVYDGALWNAAAGAAFAADDAKPFAITGWGDTLVFSGGIGKAYSLAYGPDTITELTSSPTGIIHLTTFGTRVVASVNDNSIYWTVRGDSTDWSGLGSGFEDLKSAPGGHNDVQTAVIPITDEVAYVVRSDSIWQMNLTGDFDAPFSFSRLYTHVGSKYPQSCVAIPRGLICMGDRQIWMITPEGFRDIGAPIVKRLIDGVDWLTVSSATYDVLNGEYRLGLWIPRNGGGLDQYILRYNIANGAWTEDTYPFVIRSMAYTLFNSDVSSTDVRKPGTIYAMADTGTKFVARDDESRDNNPLRDVDGTGASVAGGFRVETGDIRLADDMKQKEIVEIVLTYEASASVIINIDYSYDGGTSWYSYSSTTLPPASRPTPVSFRKTLQRDFFQLAIYTAAMPSMKLERLDVMTREAGRIVDAH